MIKVKRFLRVAFSFLPDDAYLYFRHFLTHFRIVRVRNPVTFNDYIIRSMLESPSSEKIITGDKFSVRSYLEGKGLGKYLPEMFLSISAIDEIDLSVLPSSFVMKGSHGSGMIAIYKDGDCVSRADVDKLCLKWLSTDYSRVARENTYKHMTPRVVFEELLRDPKSNAVPQDYKFYVFKGVCRAIHVDAERFSNHRRSFFDKDWNYLPFWAQYPFAGPLEKPYNLTEMVSLAERLGKDFDFVRVDLYDLGDRVVFGEMTHFPDGGNVRFYPKVYDTWFGSFFKGAL